jgi:tRNA threonylcarbamoyladenosine biosynthesis protein TsaB
MKILALDTTAKTASAALVEVRKDVPELISEYSMKTSGHSTTLLPMIESILKNTGNTAADVDLYAVSTGPGSFTGIRIGVSTVKGLAFVHDTPCVGVPSLEVLAMGFGAFRGIIVPAVDARRNTAYSAIFTSDGRGKVTRLTTDGQWEMADLEANVKKFAHDLGADAVYMPGDVVCALSRPIPAPLRYPAGFGAALAAYNKWKETDDKSGFTHAALAPVYLKKSQAEREREESLAAKNN